MKALIVTEPFAGYAKGDMIADADKVALALEHNPMQVVAIVLAEPEKTEDPAKDSPQA
jgi:hypothetical protein